jgi:hypothetical protein
MTKKKRRSKDEQPAESFEHKVQDVFKNINVETAQNESVEDQADLTGVSPAEVVSEDASAEEKAGSAETAVAEGEADGDAAAPAPASSELSQSQAAEVSEEVSIDDLLDDVRQSLIEDEAESEEKKTGWLGRIARGFHKDQPATESTVELAEEEVIPQMSEVPAEAPREDQSLDEIDELIEMLEPTSPAGEPTAEPVQPTPAAPEPEPEPRVDVEELKKRVFSPGERAEEPDISEVRAVVLEGEGGEEVFVEVEARKEDTAQERRQAFENSLRPYRRYLYFAVAFLGVILAVLAAGMMYTAYQRTRPPEPTPVESNLPYPVGLSLPGGLNFNLAKGSITEGEWNPTGPEWLRGTEICRWVAIPWSRQLEAVVRTLTREDAIELRMSNNDQLLYNVFSIQELTLEEMQSLDQNSPCLLLVLAEQETDKRWVVTAKP